MSDSLVRPVQDNKTTGRLIDIIQIQAQKKSTNQITKTTKPNFEGKHFEETKLSFKKITKLLKRSKTSSSNENPQAIIEENIIPSKAFIKRQFKFIEEESLKKIKQVSSLFNQEQIFQLRDLAGDFDDEIVQFAIRFTKIKEINQNEKNEFLGKLILLTSCDLINTKETINKGDFKNTILWVSERFEKKLQKIENALHNLQLQHKKSLLHNSSLAVKTQLPLEIANLILSRDGRINVGVIDSLLQRFVKNRRNPKNHEVNLINGLNLLKKSPEFREIIYNMEKPESEMAPGNALIRINLGLEFNQPVTDYHAQLAIITALLSHFRQGAGDTCFATSLVLVILSSHIGHFFRDIKELIKNSCITRQVDGEKYNFPFLFSMNNRNLTNVITIKRDGSLENGYHLWKSPSIKAICQAIGIDDIENTFDVILGQVFSKEPIGIEETQIPIRDLIKYLAIQGYNTGKWKNIGPGYLFSLGCFAYGSQVKNPVLKVWENSITGMAEALESSMIRTAIIEATSESISETFSFDDHKMIKFRNALMSRIHLQWDDTVTMKDSPIEDEKINKGAFVLYDKKGSYNYANWVRIDNPKVYQKFISQIASTLTEEHEKINREDFILKVINKYYYKNNKVDDPVKNYHKLKYAPWITKSGNNLNKVLQVYTENSKAIMPKAFHGDNAEKLLVDLLKLKEDPQNSILVRIPNLHAFSLMLSDPLLETIDNVEGIEKNLAIPGKEVANSPIPETTMKNLNDYIHQNLVSTENQEEFMEKIKEVDPSSSIKNYRNQILNILVELEPSEPVQMVAKKLELDTHLYEYLPQEMKDKIKKLHISDTNWNNKKHDIHHSFLVNPGNGILELWQIQDDDKYPKAIDQNIWVDKRNWEVYNFPNENFFNEEKMIID